MASSTMSTSAAATTTTTTTSSTDTAAALTSAAALARIRAAKFLTPHARRVYLALMCVPAGQFTTYGVLAAHLSSSPRAVGAALRRNPWAPEVPCHRVVATGGALGGYKGAGWLVKKPGRGRPGGEVDLAVAPSKLDSRLNMKIGLLMEEGVKFDSRGRVLGTPFSSFGEVTDEGEY